MKMAVAVAVRGRSSGASAALLSARALRAPSPDRRSSSAAGSCRVWLGWVCGGRRAPGAGEVVRGAIACPAVADERPTTRRGATPPRRRRAQTTTARGGGGGVGADSSSSCCFNSPTGGTVVVRAAAAGGGGVDCRDTSFVRLWRAPQTSNATTELRYTLDGTDPTATSPR